MKFRRFCQSKGAKNTKVPKIIMKVNTFQMLWSILVLKECFTGTVENHWFVFLKVNLKLTLHFSAYTVYDSKPSKYWCQFIWSAKSGFGPHSHHMPSWNHHGFQTLFSFYHANQYVLYVCFSPEVEQIEKVFATAGKQKAWDHFSKAQRKNLDMWRKQAEVSGAQVLQSPRNWER